MIQVIDADKHFRLQKEIELYLKENLSIRVDTGFSYNGNTKIKVSLILTSQEGQAEEISRDHIEIIEGN